MSERLGNPYETVVAPGILGLPSGRVMQFGNMGWALVICISIQFVATATVGTRTLVLNISDQSGTLLYRGPITFNIAAGQTVQATFGGGLPVSSASLTVFVPLPSGMSIPPSSSFSVFDTLNTDVNDSLSATAVLGY